MPNRWQQTMEQLTTYLDDDGLALYFPPQGTHRALGSDALTAHLLSLHYTLQSLDRGFALPDAERARMESGLLAFVEGRVERQHWSPRKDLDVRKLAAIAALADAGKARPAMLSSVQLNPATWPTHALIDWLRILQRMPELPLRDSRMQEVEQLLTAKVNVLKFRIHLKFR